MDIKTIEDYVTIITSNADDLLQNKCSLTETVEKLTQIKLSFVGLERNLALENPDYWKGKAKESINYSTHVTNALLTKVKSPQDYVSDLNAVKISASGINSLIKTSIHSQLVNKP